MASIPTPEQVRTLVAPLDAIDRKVLGGLVALMMAEPSKVRDPEWMSERFVQVSVVALGAGDDEAAATDADVERVRDYATRRMPDLMLAAASLFVRTAEDLRGRAGGFTFDDARAVVRGYLG